MSLALPFDAEDAFNGVFLFVTTLLGFFGGGLIGLLIGFAAGYTYIDLTSRVADLEATVNALIREKETLRQRLDEVDGDRVGGATDGGVDVIGEDVAPPEDERSR